MNKKHRFLQNKYDNDVKDKSKWKSALVLLVLLGFLLTGWAAFITIGGPVLKQVPALRTVVMNSRQNDQSFQQEAFFFEKIAPVLNSANLRNQQAGLRATEELENIFDSYKANVGFFVDDIISTKTRFAIARKMPGTWWRDDNRIDDMVAKKFETHLFSENKLVADFQYVLTRFSEDLEASDNQLLIDCRAAIRNADMPAIPLPDALDYAAGVHSTLAAFSAKKAEESVYRGIATLVMAEGAVLITGRLGNIILRNLGPKAVSVAVNPLRATASMSGVGAKTGSFLPGKGTMVVLTIGLVVGITVDWWMTEDFKAKMYGELNSYLDMLQAQLLHGVDDEMGINEALDLFVKDYGTAQRAAIKRIVTGG